MRNFYLLITLIFCALSSHAQTPILAPLESNPTLRIIDQQRQLEWASQIEKITGVNPLSAEIPETLEDCDFDFDFDLVEEGGEIFLDIDTTGLGGGIFGDEILINPDCGLEFAEGAFLTGSTIQYNAALFPFGDDADLKEDTICIDFVPYNGSTIEIKMPVSIRRKGRNIIAPTEMIGINSVGEFCIDQSMIDLPTPVQCGEVNDVLNDGYDGNGVAPQGVFQTSTFCFSYSSNAFPGTDSVAFTLCDELGICDIFTFPIELPTTVIDPGGSNLIFVDDFSSDGLFPNPNLWLDDQVYINNELGFEPVSVGVATFDGLDRTGTPYDIDFSGVGDRLTSLPIDLSSYNEDEEVYLKFYLQRKGFGLAPSFLDSFFVEFRDDNGVWREAADGFPGYLGTIPADSLEAFQFNVIQIDDDDFFHDRFQMRFSSIVSPAGIGDLWHLDYVLLQANNFEEPFFNDVAITQKPTNILKTYWQMPWDQFDANEAGELRDFITGEFFNHANIGNNIDNSSITFVETTTNTMLSGGTTFSNQNIESQSRLNVDISLNAILNDLLADIESIDDNGKRNIEVTYSIGIMGQNQIAENDQVTLNIPFDNCLAYDDGTAETQAFFPNANGGEQLAQKHTLNIADTITGIKMLFPRLTDDITNQEFMWRIYDEFPSPSANIVYESAVLNPFYIDSIRDTLQGFTTYRTEDVDGEPIGVEMPAGDFWISFVQLSEADRGIPIGFDLHDSVADSTNMFAGSDENFFDFFSFRGSLMMNPILGGKPLNSRTTEVQQLSNIMTIYPNPASDKVYVNLETGNFYDFEVQIFNNLGQLIKTVQLDSEIDVNSLSSGIYFLKVNNVRTLETFQQKLLIAK